MWEKILQLEGTRGKLKPPEMKCEMDENVNFIVNVRILER